LGKNGERKRVKPKNSNTFVERYLLTFKALSSKKLEKIAQKIYPKNCFEEHQIVCELLNSFSSSKDQNKDKQNILIPKYQVKKDYKIGKWNRDKNYYKVRKLREFNLFIYFYLFLFILFRRTYGKSLFFPDIDLLN
jgi:hypothetical protein